MFCPMTVTSKINRLNTPLILRTTFLMFTGSVDDSYWSCYGVSYILTNKIGFMCSMKLSYCLCCTHLSVWTTNEFFFVWCILMKKTIHKGPQIYACTGIRRWRGFIQIVHCACLCIYLSNARLTYCVIYIDKVVLWNIMSPIDSCIIDYL